MYVSKFGGTSVARHMKKIIEISKDDLRKIIVVSAPGKRNSNDIKVTDLLIEIAKKENYCNEDIQNILERFKGIGDDTQIYKIEERLKKFLGMDFNDKARISSIISIGEFGSAIVLAPILNREIIDPCEIIKVNVRNDDFLNAKYDEEISKKLILNKISNSNKKFIMPGFYGSCNGIIATLSRGGSDSSGAYLAYALNFKYENFTDSQVLCADPRIVSNPKKIDEMTFLELRDLTAYGFEILHQDVAKYLASKNIILHVRGISQFPENGTLILKNRSYDSKPIGVTLQSGYDRVKIEDVGLDDYEGLIFKIAKVFTNNKIPIKHMKTLTDGVVFFVESQNLINSKLNDLIYQLSLEVSISEKCISHDSGYSCFVLTGNGVGHNPLVFNKMNSIFSSLNKIPSLVTNNDHSYIAIIKSMSENNELLKLSYSKLFEEN